MSQPNRPRQPDKETAPASSQKGQDTREATRPRKVVPETKPNVLPGVISALVVVAVIGLLFVMLANRPSPQQATLYAQATEQALQVEQQGVQATAQALQALQPTLPPVATSASGEAVQPTGAKKTYTSPPPMTIDPSKNYSATITTPRGDIVVKLRADLAPETVNSFMFLSREGFYDGLTWHRVIPNFMAQGGDPEGSGLGGPGYTVKGEFTNKVLFDRPGLLAMARPGNDVNGNGSQFFITTAPYPSLNEQYTIFGEVTQGLEIVEAIPVRDPASATAPGEQIVKVSISEG